MKKLNNPKFVDKAPEKVVAAEREKADKLREHLAKLEESIAALKLNDEKEWSFSTLFS